MTLPGQAVDLIKSAAERQLLQRKTAQQAAEEIARIQARNEEAVQKALQAQQ